MYKFDVPEGSFVTGYKAHTDYAFEDLLAEAQINLQLRLLVFMTKWKKITLLDLPMPSLHLFELEMYWALLDNNLRACMHTIDPKHEAVSLAPPTTYTKIAHYSIKMALSWLS